MSAFTHATAESLPHVDIVFDRFHVMQHYSKVIDRVRRRMFKQAQGDDKSLLIDSRYLLLKSAKHPITTTRIEAGNVAIGMIRQRACGLLDTEYFKLKVRQTSTPEPLRGLYAIP